MRQAFATIFGSIGSNLVRSGFARLSKDILAAYGQMMSDMATSTTVFGKFLTKIKAALSNPLIAGPALIAVGAAMTYYSARMGAIGRGAGAELGEVSAVLALAAVLIRSSTVLPTVRISRP